MADAKKTIIKFAESYRDHKRHYEAAPVTEKLTFELITNRPIFPALNEAIDGIAEGRQLTGDAKNQAEQFKRAAALSGGPLTEFASKCQITGLAGSLKATKTNLSKILVDWSATVDARARARLGDMRDMVRKKAGHDAEHQKVIRQVDVLDALGLSDVEDLLPCPSSLAKVGKVVEREQVAEAAILVPSLAKPLLVHAAGGVGKTVFLNSLASSFQISMRWSSLTALEGELTAHPKMDGTFRAVGSCILPMNSPAGGSAIPSCQAAITLKCYFAHFGRGLRSASGRSPQRPRPEN